MILDTLKQLGLNDKEAEIYLEVYKRGKSTPGAISHSTGINRASVYVNAQNLIKKGVLLKDLGAKTFTFTALPRDELSVLMDKEKKELKKKKELIERAMQELSPLRKDIIYAIPTIRFIETEDIEDFLYKQSPKWIKSIRNTDNIWWGFQDHTFVEEYKNWIDWHWTTKELDRGEMILQLLSNESKIEEKMKKERYEHRHIRFWKDSFNFTATTWITGDYMTIIYTRDKPFYLIEIESAVVASNQREVFKNIWEDTKED